MSTFRKLLHPSSALALSAGLLLSGCYSFSPWHKTEDQFAPAGQEQVGWGVQRSLKASGADKGYRLIAQATPTCRSVDTGTKAHKEQRIELKRKWLGPLMVLGGLVGMYAGFKAGVPDEGEPDHATGIPLTVGGTLIGAGGIIIWGANDYGDSEKRLVPTDEPMRQWGASGPVACGPSRPVSDPDAVVALDVTDGRESASFTLPLGKDGTLSLAGEALQSLGYWAYECRGELTVEATLLSGRQRAPVDRDLAPTGAPPPPKTPAIREADGIWPAGPAVFQIQQDPKLAAAAVAAGLSNPVIELGEGCIRASYRQCEEGDLDACHQALRHTRDPTARIKYETLAFAIRKRQCAGNVAADIAGDPNICRQIAGELSDPKEAAWFHEQAFKALKDQQDLDRKRRQEEQREQRAKEREQRIHAQIESVRAERQRMEAERRAAEEQRRQQAAAAAAAQQDSGGLSFAKAMALGVGGAFIAASPISDAAKVKVGTALAHDVITESGGTAMQKLSAEQDAAANKAASGGGEGGSAAPMKSHPHTFACKRAGAKLQTINIPYKSQKCLNAKMQYTELMACNQSPTKAAAICSAGCDRSDCYEK